MTTTVDTIRTVFDAQFTGANVFQQVTKQVNLTETAFDKLSKSWDKMGTTTIGKGVFSANLQQLAIAGGIAATGIVAVGKALIDLYPIAQEGAGIGQLNLSFERLNQNVLHAPDLLNDFNAAAKGTITRAQSMQAFLTLTAGASDELSRSFAESAPKLMEIAKAANVLNPTLGDTNYMFNSLARGIKRNEVRLLDNLGIIIKSSEANKRFAESLGKSVQELTAEEKQMATLNEVLRVGQNLINQVGGDTEALTDRYQRLTSSWENFVDSFKMGIAATYLTGQTGPVGLLDTMADRMRMIAELRFWEQQGKLAEGAGDKTFWSTEALRAYYEEQKKAVAEVDALIAKSAASWQEWYRILTKEDVKNPITSPEAERNVPGSGQVDEWKNRIKNAVDGARDSFENYDDYLASNAQWRLKMLKDEATAAEELQKAQADLANQVEKHNAKVFEEYQKQVAKTGDLLMQWSGDNSLYTTTIDNLGDAFVTVGGRTEEQNQLLEDFRSAQEKADEQVRDYTTGLKGFGQEQDKINEKIQEGAEKSAFYAQKVAELEAVQGDLQKVHQGAVWNMEAIYAELINQNDAAGANVDLLAKLKMATGEWTEEQSQAAIKSAALADALGRIAAGGAPAIDQLMALNDTMKGLEQINWDNVFRPWQQVNRDLPGMNRQVGKLKEGWQNANDPYGGFYDEINPVLEDRYADATRKELEQYFPGLVEPETLLISTDLDPDSVAAVRAELDALTATETKYIKIVEIAPGAPEPGRRPENVGNQRALGGPVSRGVPYLVGERGPELFIPDNSGDIVPNNKLPGGDNITINNYNEKAAAMAMALLELQRTNRIRSRVVP